MRFVCVVPEELGEELDAAAAEAGQRERDWWSAARLLVDERFSPVSGAEASAAAAVRRAERRAAIDEMRERGEVARAAGLLLGSRDRLVAFHLRQLLVDRGWDRAWPEVPGGGSRPGRRWGSPNRAFRARVSLDLPDDLGIQVRRSAYWVSAEAVEQLQVWADRFGPGPASALYLEPVARALGGGPGGPRALDLADRDRLRDQVVTAGDILRAAMTASVAADAPEPPPL